MKRKQLAVLFGTAVMSTSLVLPCMAQEAAGEVPEIQTEAKMETASEETASLESEELPPEEAPDVAEVPEEEPVPETDEAIPEISEEEVDESTELDTEEDTSSDSTKVKKDADKAASEGLVDVDGLIEDDGTVVSDSIEGDPEMPLEELWDDQMHNRQFPGFEVDPSRYPSANITVNTVVLYRFLTRRMDLNHAAACGVLANIQLESNFRPLALGDSGTSYGICQWHNGRFTSLMNYCKQHELDYNTLEGQIAYLEWDLTHGYKGVYEALLNVEDSEEGAYRAGYLFCFRFEMPDQVEARSKRRGNLARDEYYGKDFDLLEWELRHNTLISGKDGLVPAAGDLQGPEVLTLLDRWEAQEEAEVEAVPTPVQQQLPEWQSALGEISMLL